MPDATGLELIAQRVREAVGDEAVADTCFFREQATLEVAAARAHDPCSSYLRDDDEEPWPQLASLHGVDYLPEEPRLGVHYQLLSMERAERLCVKTRWGSTTRACRAWSTCSPRPTSRSARSTTCSAWSSRATPTRGAS